MKKLNLFLIFCLLCIPLIVKAQTPLENSFSLLEDHRIITDVSSANVTDSSYLVCKEDAYIPYQIVRVVRSVISLIKYIVPILLILMGMMDFGKVVFGKPDEQMKKAKNSFIARLVAAVLVFLVIMVVQMVLGMVSTDDQNVNCLRCFVLDEDCRYVDISYPETEKTPTPTTRPKPTPTSSPTSTPTSTPTPSAPAQEVEPTISPSASFNP